jgi:hypothetical protein
MKTCAKCGEAKRPEDFRTHRALHCADCKRAAARDGYYRRGGVDHLHALQAHRKG